MAFYHEYDKIVGNIKVEVNEEDVVVSYDSPGFVAYCILGSGSDNIYHWR